MAIYYHTQSQVGGGYVVWSQADSLTAAGKTLAKQNRTWPDKSTDGQIITIGKRPRGCHNIRPFKYYRLDGDKLRKVDNWTASIERGNFFNF